MIRLMPMGDFFYEQYQFADKFNVLQLNDAELALLSAIMILNPGQCVTGSLGFWVSGLLGQ